MVTVKEVAMALEAHIKTCDERHERIEKSLDACNTGIGQVHSRISRLTEAQNNRTIRVLAGVVVSLILVILGMAWDVANFGG